MRAEDRAQTWQMTTPGVAASRRTRRRGYTPPQQPQRSSPGTAAKIAGNANMTVIMVASAHGAKDRAEQPLPGR
jgi:N-acetylmuramoyl-L-alanine amidase